MKEFIQQSVRAFFLSNAFFVFNFLGNLVLIRLLAPEIFGVVALAMALVGIVEIGTTFSLHTIYLQRRPSSSLISTIVQLIALVLVVKIIGGLLVFGIAKEQYSQQIWILFGILFISKMLVPFNALLVAILEKDLKFVRSTLIVKLSNTIAMILAICAVLAGADVYGLVLRNVLPIVFVLIFAGYFNRHLTVPWRKYNRRQMKTVARSSMQMYGVRAAELSYGKIPLLVVQSMFGVEVLGLLTQSLYLVNSLNTITSVINQQIGVVFFNKFRKDMAAVKKGGWIMISFTIALGLPIFVLFYVYPQQVIGFLWGEKWIAAVPMLKVLSFVVLLLPIYTILKSQLYGDRKNNRISWAYLAGTVILVAILQLPVMQDAGSGLVAAAFVASYIVMILISMPWQAITRTAPE